MSSRLQNRSQVQQENAVRPRTAIDVARSTNHIILGRSIQHGQLRCDQQSAGFSRSLDGILECCVLTGSLIHCFEIFPSSKLYFR